MMMLWFFPLLLLFFVSSNIDDLKVFEEQYSTYRTPSSRDLKITIEILSTLRYEKCQEAAVTKPPVAVTSPANAWRTVALGLYQQLKAN